LDVRIVRAWIEGRSTPGCESWAEFHQRVAAAWERLRALAGAEPLVVSTSATPIGIGAGITLELAPRHVMRLAAELHNASLTAFRLERGEWRLASFNNVPHLSDGLLTRR